MQIGKVVENLKNIKERLKDIPQKFQLEDESYTVPKIIAVSKTHGKDKIVDLINAGHRIFGENRVQEAASKWPELKKTYSDIKLHLIGPLQSNKAKEAVTIFDCIQTIDREKIAKAIAEEMKKQQKKLDLFIQINIGEEEQKAGIQPKEADKFIKYCRDDLELNIKGLMCIPPLNEEPAMHFALLKKIAERNNIKELSMGMSGDFETAAALGATYIRVGTAIFGERYAQA